MENFNKNNDNSLKNEISTDIQTKKILITQKEDIQTSTENKKKKKSLKKKKTPKKIKKEDLTEEEISKFRLQDKTISSSFISYYTNLLDFDESEFSLFLKTSVEDLPIIFRINKIYTYSESLEEEISEYLLLNKDHFNNRVTRPRLNFLDNIYQINSFNKSNEIESILKKVI